MKTAAPTRRARRSAWAAALIAAALIMAGCGSSGPKPGSSPVDLGPPSTPPTSAAPTASAPPTSEASSYINAAPGETPPVRPPDEKTDAGVEAFIRYWLQVSNVAYTTMDPTVLRAIALPSCDLCTLVVQSIDDDRSAGRRYEGSQYTIKGIVFNTTTGGDTIRSANIWVDATEYTIFAPDGSIVLRDDPETNSQMSLSVEYRGSKWFLASLYVVINK